MIKLVRPRRAKKADYYAWLVVRVEFIIVLWSGVTRLGDVAARAQLAVLYGKDPPIVHPYRQNPGMHDTGRTSAGG